MDRPKVRHRPRNFKRTNALRALHRRLTAPGMLLLGLSACGVPAPTPVPLELIARTPLDAPAGERMDDLHLVSPDGDTVRAVLRWPAARRNLGGVVLVAGRETGRQAAALIPGPLEAAVLAVEYPEDIPERIDAGALRELRHLRATARRMPGVVLGASDHLIAFEPIDPARVLLVGVSFGVPFAAAAGRDERFAAVALLHGGADIGMLLRENLEGPRWQRRILSAIGGWAFRGLEPAHHVPHIAPRRLLLVNGLNDEMVPRRSAELLREAAEGPVRHVWLPHGHLMPRDHDKMRELADTTARAFPEIVYGGESRRDR